MATYTHGKFVWRELMTTDVQAALRFYGELFGWKSTATEVPNGTYWLLNAGEKQVAGVMGRAGDMSFPPFWNSYVSVADVDAACDRAKKGGGQVLWGPVDMEGIGRMAMVMDAEHGVFSVFKDAKGDTPQALPKPGEFCWEQLNASDVSAAKKFYTDVVGWKTQGSPAGMETFGVGTEMSDQAASLMQAPPGVPTHWLTYVVVEKLESSRDRAERLGAKVFVKEIAIPQIGRIAVIADPQGAAIGLFESAM